MPPLEPGVRQKTRHCVGLDAQGQGPHDWNIMFTSSRVGFGVACWRRLGRASTIERAVASTPLRLLPGSSPLWGAGLVPGEWMDCCGLISRLARTKSGSSRNKVRSSTTGPPSAYPQWTKPASHHTRVRLLHAWAPHSGRRRSRGALQFQGTKGAHQVCRQAAMSTDGLTHQTLF